LTKQFKELYIKKDIKNLTKIVKNIREITGNENIDVKSIMESIH